MKERIAHIAGGIAAAALSAYACKLAIVHTTPIDRALPFVAVVLWSAGVLAGWPGAVSAPTRRRDAAEPAAGTAALLLILAEIAISDETMRLLAFGVIVAATFACTRLESPWSAVAAILILRWIPLEDVLVWRELFLLAIAVAIVFVLGRTPFAVAVATITALVTPTIPLRTFALPLAVLVVAILARMYGMPRLRWTLPSVVVVAFAMLFFAWSGIVARAFPYFLKPARAEGQRLAVNAAIPPSVSVTYSVPHDARALIVSGANVPRFRRGVLLGTIEPGAIPVRIGDVADWGYMRRDHYYGTHNPLPRVPAGKIRGYGYGAWVDGAGRIPLPRGAKTIRVTAASTLPRDASLQVVAFELAAR